MAITGIGNNYTNVYGRAYVSQKNETIKKTETKNTTFVQTGKKSVLNRRQSEDIKKLSSTSAYGIMNEFEKIMSEPGEEKGTGNAG